MVNNAANIKPVSSRRLGLPLLVLVTLVALGCLLAAASAQSKGVIATALFQVSSKVPTILGNERTQRVGRENFEIVKKSQLALLRSHFVLSYALRNPAVAGLPIFHGQADPVEWLQQHLEVVFPEDSEVLAISLRGPDAHAEDLVQLVDAVAKAYRDEVIYEGKQRSLASRDLLARSLENLKKEIERNFEEFLDIAREAGRVESGSGQVMQELDMKQLDRVETELMRLESELVQAEAGDGSENGTAIEQRIGQLRERQAELEKKLTSRAEKSVELTTRQQDLERLRRIADRMSIKLEMMDIEANAPERIRQIQPAVVGPAD